MFKAVHRKELIDTPTLSCVMQVAKALYDQQIMWDEGHNLGSRMVNIKQFMKEICSL
jgi:hypothetical protein